MAIEASHELLPAKELQFFDPVGMAATFPATHCLETLHRVLFGRQRRSRGPPDTRSGAPRHGKSTDEVSADEFAEAAGRGDPAMALASAAASRPGGRGAASASADGDIPLAHWALSVLLGPAALTVEEGPARAEAPCRPSDDEEVAVRRPLLEGGASRANVLVDGIDTVLEAELTAAERGERRQSSLGGAPFDDDDDAMVGLGAFDGDGDILGAELVRAYFQPEDETPAESPAGVGEPVPPGAAESAAADDTDAGLGRTTPVGSGRAAEAAEGASGSGGVADDVSFDDFDDDEPTSPAAATPGSKVPPAGGSGKAGPSTSSKGAAAAAGPGGEPPAAATPGFGSPLNVAAALRSLDAALDASEDGGEEAAAAGPEGGDDGLSDDEAEPADDRSGLSVASSVDRELAGESEPTGVSD